MNGGEHRANLRTHVGPTVVRLRYDRAGRVRAEIVSAEPFIDLDPADCRRVDTPTRPQVDR